MRPKFFGIIIPRTLEHSLSANSRWLASIWQALPKSLLRRLLNKKDHFSLEILGEPDRVWPAMWVPSAGLARVIQAQIRSQFPDVEFQELPDLFEVSPFFATASLVLQRSREFGLRKMKETEADSLAGVLASLGGLRENERAAVQILIRPSTSQSSESPAFQVVIRLWTAARSSIRARSLLSGLIAAFGGFAGENSLKPINIRIKSRPALRHLQARQWPFIQIFPTELTLEEITMLYHIPSPAKVHVPQLQTISARRLSPRTGFPSEGIKVGLRSTAGREVRVLPEDLIRHMAVFGATGTGKSTLLINLGLQLIKSGHGLTVLDPHGTLIDGLLHRIPSGTAAEVIIIRFADIGFPVGLNFLEARPGFEFLIIDELVEIFRRLYGADFWGPVLDMVLRHAAQATLETGGTLVEMARLLDDEEYRLTITPRIRNAETRRFLEGLSDLTDARREHRVASTLNRLQRLLGTAFLRNVVGQGRSAIDFHRVMDAGQILLVDLSGIGMLNAQLLGSLLTLRFRQAALARTAAGGAQRKLHFLLLDEASWFISRTIGEMADQVRKFGLGLVLAMQRVGQLRTNEIREAVFANAGNLLTFQIGDREDSLYLARHLNTHGLTGEEIRSLGRFEAYGQFLVKGQRFPAFWAMSQDVLPPAEGSDQKAKKVVEMSRERYSKPREVVEAEIANRFEGVRHEDQEKRPRRGTVSDRER